MKTIRVRVSVITHLILLLASSAGNAALLTESNIQRYSFWYWAEIVVFVTLFFLLMKLHNASIRAEIEERLKQEEADNEENDLTRSPK